MELELFYEGDYSKLDKERKEEMEGYSFNPELYKDWSKIIKKDFEKFKEVILVKYKNKEKLENLCDFLIKNITTTYIFDYSRIGENENSIILFDNYVSLSYYSKYYTGKTINYALNQLIYNRNFKEFYESCSDFYINSFIDSNRTIDLIKYTLEGNTVISKELKYKGYVDTSHEENLVKSLKMINNSKGN